jgi:exo-1,4-beta-D-glucosaminidase
VWADRSLSVAALFLVFPAAAQVRHIPAPAVSRIDLRNGWQVQSSAVATQAGREISTAGFNPRGWYPTRVPSTVVNTLVSNGLYPDPYYGMNLRLIPGTTYDLGDNFAVDPMPAGSPFISSWWYRTVFRLPPATAGRHLSLNFDSINYRAHVWLNGKLIADSGQIVGMYRKFELDVTGIAVPGAANALAVEVFAPTEHDLSLTFVDWNPLPADKDMGLVRDVYILAGGPVTMRNVQVLTSLASTLDQAHLTIYADLRNSGAEAVEGTLEGRIGSIAVSQTVRLAPGESTTAVFSPQSYPQLNMTDPQLWWPYGLGPQNLYQLHLEFRVGGGISDKSDVQFGIRQVTSELDALQHRVFRINGKRILIRGAGWAPDMMLRIDHERTEYELRYARDMHLNTIRLEGRLEMDDYFFDAADRLGIMIIAGWSCCAAWEQWDGWQAEHYTVAAESLRDQLRRLRNHPSVFVFLYGSDNAPPPAPERMYLDIFAEQRWPNPTIASATDATTVGGGRTGVKMTGPYDYVAPNYWLLNTNKGGAFGFITETGPGPAIPELASLQAMMPEEYLWPIDNGVWNFHAGSGSFADTRNFSAALEGRYGPAKNLEDYVKKSQLMTYEAQRAMFEAYGRNKYTSTGVIQWMLNNAWPGLIWHLYDWYLRPGGGYFGTKKANELVHVQYSYDDGSVVVVNSLYRRLPGYSVSARVYNLDLEEKYSRTTAIDIPEDSSSRVFLLPQIAGLSRTYFVKLELRDPDGALASSNFYWLSTQPDVNDWVGGDYRYAPITTYADLTGLEQLPPATVAVTWRSEAGDPDQVEHVTVENTSSQLAFFVHLTVRQGKGGADIAPVYWEDNYFELMPGEKRELTATYPRKLLRGAESFIHVDGWNVAAN